MPVPYFEQSADDLLTLFAQTPDLVCIAGRDGYFKNFNKAVEHTLGYSRQELMSVPIFTFLHPADLMATRQTRRLMLEGKALVNFRNRYINKNGSIVWLEWTSVYFPEKEIVFAIAKNITERVYEEERRITQLQETAGHFKEFLEQEKKLIAHELHESIAQMASALKVGTDWIHGELKRLNILLPPTVQSKMEDLQKTGTQLMKAVEQLSFNIRPIMLDDLGLEITLESYCETISSVSGTLIQLKYQIPEKISHQVSSTEIFRTVQEAVSVLLSQYKSDLIVIQVGYKKKSNLIELRFTASFRKNSEQDTWDGLRKRILLNGGNFELKGVRKTEISVQCSLPIGSS